MGILEIHLHDSEFSWSVNPGTGRERSLSLGMGSKSKRKSGRKSGGTSSGSGSSDGRDGPSIASKLGPIAVLGLVIGGIVAFNRLRSRRKRESAEAESRSSGRRLSLFRGK